jgi:hypothetical protein
MTRDRNKLPRIPREYIPYILRRAADKAERGEVLLVGEVEPGTRRMEGDIVAVVLRAVADGRSPIKALVGDGPQPRSRHELIRRVNAEIRKYGTGRGAQAKAFAAIAKTDKRSAAAVKADFARAQKEERESWRRKYLAGRWPSFRHWMLTDAEIDTQVEMDRTGCTPAGERVDFAKRWVDREGNAVDPHAMYRRLRAEEMKQFTKLTGWKSPPRRDGDKS